MSDDSNSRDLIIALRGGIPAKCDFCGKETPPERMDPEEGGEWVCYDCEERWEREEREK